MSTASAVYSAVLPPSLMVFLIRKVCEISEELKISRILKVLVDLIKVLDIENIGPACDAQTRLLRFHNIRH